jgi:hypothetical protein
MKERHHNFGKTEYCSKTNGASNKACTICTRISLEFRRQNPVPQKITYIFQFGCIYRGHPHPHSEGARSTSGPTIITDFYQSIPQPSMKETVSLNQATTSTLSSILNILKTEFVVFWVVEPFSVVVLCQHFVES